MRRTINYCVKKRGLKTCSVKKALQDDQNLVINLNQLKKNFVDLSDKVKKERVDLIKMKISAEKEEIEYDQ